MKSLIALFFITFLFIQLSHSQSLELEFYANNLNKPVSIKHAGDDKLYVVEQSGYIKIVNTDGSIESTAFLDIDNIVINTGSERGLLGLAFHPNYSTNGYFFVNYINNSGNTVISRFSRQASNPLLADASSELVIIDFIQPYSNHNGGDLAFGSDGYLYIATGDGGSGGDPDNYSQNTLSLLGKILRLDIDSPSGTENYSIPADNPFLGDTNIREEIWAYGLRNPWRFSFDRLNGDVWIADVGQNAYEEINHVTALEASTGLNYGWRCYEGNLTYNTNGCSTPSSYTYPIEGYNHFGDGESKCSITGGYRYRGTQFPNFNGYYFFADYCSQEIGYLVYNDTTDTWTKILQDFNGNWSSFGEDVNGELYVSDPTSGSIYKITDTSLGIHDNLISEISVYPNPTENKLSINFGLNYTSELSAKISIFDLQGKQIKTIQRNTEMIQNISTSELSNGIYILKVVGDNNKQFIHKLVKH
ncbi:PQQ-dependent sugar dehydrogenase [uncultured Winogradskyella sp.]|uniref:PQQ-dependent sugar dehydrogenase n=1 Tax=uncultured Winogradskyella sp. TaxID=395353 RepID=UPI002604B698|nr:PQQ-dependent sugar dehydrogenase [uncultured Winogradskyella sp.]|tara:strand:+ start:1063 stop:2484 length:1422 start_codon:yes stop_codon:yes gene_type:complete